MAVRKNKPKRIDRFGLRPGRQIGPRYRVVSVLGRGVEGEVYQIEESDTGILRAAKIYFPHRDPSNRSTIWYAHKLNTLRHCPIVLQYHHTEVIRFGGQKIRCLISELAEGEQLEQWVAHHRGGRLPAYRALHVLYDLVRGLEAVHALGEYHADVHSQNILIRPRGVHFQVKLVDFYNWGKPARYKQHQDIMDCIRVFHECLGGPRYYKRAAPEARYIIANLRRNLVIKRFPTMTALRRHLESFEWRTLLT